MKIRIAAFLVMSLVLAFPAAARTAEECARISDPDSRLSCFDAPFVTEVPAVPTGEWTVRDTRSALDDSRTVILSVRSQHPLPGRFGRAERASLIIRCEENTTALYIVWGGHFMSDIQGGGRVDYRIDTRPAGHVSMRVSTDNMALGLWNGRASIPFVRRLLDGEQLYVRSTPFSESRVAARFAIARLAEAIRPLRAACNW